MYVYGGTLSGDYASHGLADVWRYQFPRGVWFQEAKRSPAGPRFFASATPLPGNKVVLIALGVDNLDSSSGRADFWAVMRADAFAAGEDPRIQGYAYAAANDPGDPDEMDRGRLAWIQLQPYERGGLKMDRYAHTAGFRDPYLYVFSGHASLSQALANQATASAKVHYMQPGCNVGSYSPHFATVPCRLCNPGYD